MKKQSPPKVYGVLGYPVKHSLSPAMHNAAFRALGINAEYRLFEVTPEKLEDFLLKDIEVKDTQGKSFFSQDIIGFNITIPHKVRAKEILFKVFPPPPESIEGLFPYASRTGAVNTVKRENDKPIYWNTDVSGFYRSLKEDLKFDPRNKNVFLIGCGGAGRAIITCLTWKTYSTSKIYIYEQNNNVANSAENHFLSFLSQPKLEFILPKQIPEALKKCQLLVNASPVGMKEGDPSPVDKKFLHKELYVYDVVYNRQTQLIEDAKTLLGSKKVKNGLGMLFYQGVAAFKFWRKEKLTKQTIEIMRQALSEAVDKA